MPKNGILMENQENMQTIEVNSKQFELTWILMTYKCDMR